MSHLFHPMQMANWFQLLKIGNCRLALYWRLDSRGRSSILEFFCELIMSGFRITRQCLCVACARVKVSAQNLSFKRVSDFLGPVR